MDAQYQQIVSDYNYYLAKMFQAMEHFCDDLSESNYSEISMTLPSIVEGLDWINNALEKFVARGEISAESYALFQNLVKSLTESLENKDYLLLHDLFRYEMLPLLGQLKVAEIKN